MNRKTKTYSQTQTPLTNKNETKLMNRLLQNCFYDFLQFNEAELLFTYSQTAMNTNQSVSSRFQPAATK